MHLYATTMLHYGLVQKAHGISYYPGDFTTEPPLKSVDIEVTTQHEDRHYVGYYLPAGKTAKFNVCLNKFLSPCLGNDSGVFKVTLPQVHLEVWCLVIGEGTIPRWGLDLDSNYKHPLGQDMERSWKTVAYIDWVNCLKRIWSQQKNCCKNVLEYWVVLFFAVEHQKLWLKARISSALQLVDSSQ